MVKNNPAMLDMISKQMGGNVDPVTLQRGMGILATIVGIYTKIRNLMLNKVF